MKKFIISSILVTLLSAGLALKAQSQEEYLGLPGDNLNLYAVMQLFQDSKTLEEFERNLNDPKNNIDNLDLNGDNLVDYIKVLDDIDGNVHNIVLQVAVTPRENQDVAVFTVQRFNNGQVSIQLTGDEALYGRNYIIEPNTAETANPGYSGTYYRTTSAEIAYWPVVRFIYMPAYSPWHSSWYWGYYPSYWSPWRPYSWHYYYGYHYNWNNYYYGHYHHSDQHYYARWNDYYYHNKRSYSHEVSQNIKHDVYKTTYSHPEQRHEGEIAYSTRHPENSNSGNSRRSDYSGSAKPSDHSYSNSGNSRKPDNNVPNKSNGTRSFSNSDYSRRLNQSISKPNYPNPGQAGHQQSAQPEHQNPGQASHQQSAQPEHQNPGQASHQQTAPPARTNQSSGQANHQVGTEQVQHQRATTTTVKSNDNRSHSDGSASKTKSESSSNKDNQGKSDSKEENRRN